MKVGIGYVNLQDSFKAGVGVTEEAVQKGRIEKPTFAFAFCSGRTDSYDFVKGIRDVLGNVVPVLGGAAIGIITNEHLSYDDYPCGIIVIEAENIGLQIKHVSSINKDEFEAGFKLGTILDENEDERFLLMFYDSVKQQAKDGKPIILNASPLIINGVEKGLNRNVPMLGAGLVGLYKFLSSKLFLGDSIADDTLLGVMFSGEFDLYYKIMHGCTPLDGIYYTITKINGPIIYEIDNRPATDLIDEIFGDRNWQKQNPIRNLTIGVNLGDKFADFNDANYINRLIVSVLPEEKAIILFEPDLAEGMEIQFMVRDNNVIYETTRNNSNELISEIKAAGKEPHLGFYIDCAGRTSLYSNSIEEEGAEVQKAFNQYGIPLFGFYSGVEIAPLQGKSRGLDWTGVLVILATDNKKTD